MSTDHASVRLEDMDSVLGTEEFAAVAKVDPDTIRDLTRVGAVKRLLYTRKHQYDRREVSRFLRESSDPDWWQPFGEALAQLRAKRRKPAGPKETP